MPDRSEIGGAPGSQETVGFGPTVEEDAKEVPAQDPVGFGKSGLDPLVSGIVQNGAPVSGAVIYQVRRVGEDEIHARGGHLPHPRRLRDDYVPTGYRGYGVETRAVKGHEFGLKLNAEDKAALIAFLRTL
jgi:hypothetical protein